MSHQQDRPPPLPPRRPAHHEAPHGRDTQPPRSSSGADVLPQALGSLRESWRQIKSSLSSESQPSSSGLKPPSLPPRPRSPSAASPVSQSHATPTPSTHGETEEVGRDAEQVPENIDELLGELAISPEIDPDPLPSDEPTHPETCCISAVMTFHTTWYFHPDAPEVPICSRCYNKYLRDTRFGNDFKGRYLDDNAPRSCKFSTLKVRERLFKEALASKSLEALILHMKSRSKIPDCKGTGGVNGSEGFKWYRAKNGAIPGFIICEACWEDHASVYSFSTRFEVHATPQGQDDTWACDLAVPFIRKVYEQRSRAGDWPGFVAEATTRLQIAPCPKMEQVTYASRNWFCPKAYPFVLICAGCFCDHVFGGSEEAKWRPSAQDQSIKYSDDCVCVLGHFEMNMAMMFAQDRKDPSIFWDALRAAMKGPSCEPEGTKGAVWYTLRSDPKDYNVCGVCYVSIIQSMGMTKFFVPKTGISPGAAPRCCLNMRFPRFGSYLTRLFESYYTQSTASLESFAAAYAQLPLCRREKTLQNGVWYGWPDCAICPECHHEFARSTALAASMPLRATVREGHTMCHMYSPRMRALYMEACALDPPDPTALIQFSNHRTGVYMQTVLVINRILEQQKMAFYQQQMLHNQSLFYTHLGNTESVTMGPTGSWGAAGVGYGFENQNQLQGAIYGKQARDVGAQVSSVPGILQLGELERQWRAVE